MPEILVAVSYTDKKYYARPLYPKAFNDLEGDGNALLFIDENEMPKITTFDSGDILCAEARAYAIEKAIKDNYDYVFFLDIDAIPERGILTKLINSNYPFIAGSLCARGNSDLLIGHNYKDRESLERVPLEADPDGEDIFCDGVTGGLLLVHRSVYSVCNYKGYTGVYCLPDRTTCDDEYYMLQVYKNTGLKPKLNPRARAWHLGEDGKAYMYKQPPRAYIRTKTTIEFNGEIYEHREQ